MHLFNCGCARNTRLLPLNKTIILQEVHRGSRFTVNQRHYNEYRLPPLPQARSVPTAVGAHLVFAVKIKCTWECEMRGNMASAVVELDLH